MNRINHPDFPSLSTLTSGDNEPKLVSSYVPLTSASLDLEEELLAQYNLAKKLIHDAEYDSEIPLNQKAQAINSAAAILGALIKNQADLYSLERIKKIEAILLRTLQRFPSLQEDFMAEYSTALGV